jgi:hypothetical protein
MFPTDIFCRAAIYPNCNRKDRFDTAALLQFSDLPNLSRALSLAGWDKCGSVAMVHDFGCKTTEAKNERKRIDAGGNLDEIAASYYLGYYSFFARQLRADNLQYTRAVLRHALEDGDDRHYQFELHPLEGITEEKKVKNDERIARDCIALLLFGPEAFPDHLCSQRQISLKSEFLCTLPR